MRTTLAFAAAGLLVACSDVSDGAPAAHADAAASSPPVITFAIGPTTTVAGPDGEYALAVVLGYTDDAERVVSFELETDDASFRGPLAPPSDGLTTAAVKLAACTEKGRLTYQLRIVSESGVTSTPFSDVVLVQ